MERYKNLNGNSSVIYYDILPDRILVIFKGGMQYVYTVASVGSDAFETMKFLAARGFGLCSFIQNNVRSRYVSKVLTTFRI